MVAGPSGLPMDSDTRPPRRPSADRAPTASGTPVDRPRQRLPGRYRSSRSCPAQTGTRRCRGQPEPGRPNGEGHARQGGRDCERRDSRGASALHDGGIVCGRPDRYPIHQRRRTECITVHPPIGCTLTLVPASPRHHDGGNPHPRATEHAMALSNTRVDQHDGVQPEWRPTPCPTTSTFSLSALVSPASEWRTTWPPISLADRSPSWRAARRSAEPGTCSAIRASGRIPICTPSASGTSPGNPTMRSPMPTKSCPTFRKLSTKTTWATAFTLGTR